MTARRPTTDTPQPASDPVVGTESHQSARRSSTCRNVGMFILAGVVGFTAPWMLLSTVNRRLPSISPTMGDLVIGLVVILALGIASVIVHELGHLLGGRFAGFRTMVFAIWPILLRRTPGGRWSVRAHASLALGMGLVLSVPTETHNLRRRLMCWTAGGPAASLLVGLLALVAFFWLTPDRAAHSSGALTLALVAGAGGLISLAFAVVSLLPMSDMTGNGTDGARLLELLRGGTEAEVQGALSVLVGCSVSGVRPRRWDQSLVQSALAAPPNTAFGKMARYFAYESALDRDNLTEARRLLHETLAAEERSSGRGRPELFQEAAWFAAVHDEDPRTARERFALASAHGSGETHERLIAEAAVLASEHQRDAAASCLRAAVEELTSSRGIVGPTDVARERIAHLSEVLGIDAPWPDAPSSPGGLT